MLLLEAVDTMMGRHGYCRRELDDFLARYGYPVQRVGTEDVMAFPPPARDRFGADRRSEPPFQAFDSGWRVRSPLRRVAVPLVGVGAAVEVVEGQARAT